MEHDPDLDILYRELGRLCVSHSNLEKSLRFLVQALLNTSDRDARIETNRFVFQRLRKRARKEIERKLGGLPEEADLVELFEDLDERVDWCVKGRNVYIHSEWADVRDSDLPGLDGIFRSKDVVDKGRGEYKSRWQLASVSGIGEVSDIIDETCQGLWELVYHLQLRGHTAVLPEPRPRKGKPPIRGPIHFKGRTLPLIEDHEDCREENKAPWLRHAQKDDGLLEI